MKILGVKFKNLNSLKDEHEVNFNIAPFSEGGLFAITGPTGAGKTTILDAITVGLYGKVPRINSDNKVVNPFEILSKHEVEAYSEVTFEVNGKQYRSKWSTHRAGKKRNGNFQGPKMELVDLSTNIPIEERLSKVPGVIAELTGLDYDRFLRSVMLSQGEFAAFLKAKESERGELLEKITGTEIYSDISIAAHKREREEKRVLQELELQLNNHKLLTEEELATIEQELLLLKEEKGKIEEEITSLQKFLQWLEKLTKLESRIEALKESQANLEAEKERDAAELIRLEQHEKAITLQAELARLQLISRQINTTSQQVDDLKLEISNLQQNIGKANNELKESEATYQQKVNQLQESKPLFSKVRKLDQEIAIALSEVRNIGGQVNNFNKTLEELRNQYKTSKRKKEELEKFREESKAWLEENSFFRRLEEDLPSLKQKHAVFADYSNELLKRESKLKALVEEADKLNLSIEEKRSKVHLSRSEWIKINALFQAKEEELIVKLNNKELDDWDNDYSNFSSQLKISTEQLRLATEYNTRAERKLRIVADLAKVNEQLELKRNSIPKLDSDLATALEKLAYLDQLCELESKLSSFEEERKKLKSGEPCPLCGSKEHPLAANYDNKVEESQQRRKEQREVVQKLHTAVITAKAEEQAALKEVQSLKVQLEEREDELLQLQRQFERNNSELLVEWNIADVKLVEEFHLSLVKQHDNCKNVLSSAKALLDATNKLRDNMDARTASINQLTMDLQASEVKLQGINANKANAETEVSEQKLQVAGIRSQIDAILLPYKAVLSGVSPDKVLKVLETHREVFVKKTEELALTENNLNLAKAEMEGLFSQGKLKGDEYSAAVKVKEEKQGILDALQVQRNETFGDKAVDTEEERLQKEINQALTQLNSSKEQYQQSKELLSNKESLLKSGSNALENLQADLLTQEKELEEEAAKKGFSSLEILKAALLDEKEYQALKTRKETIQTQLIENQHSLHLAKQELGEEKEKQLTELEEPELKAQMLEKSRLRSHFEQLIGQQTLRLRQDQELRLKYMEQMERVERQLREWKKWNTLSELIGSADGKKFSTFAQGLTLARLVRLANKHLAKLNQRYIIRKNNERDLELEIVDTFQADEVRPMKTLSGGESFLVSLALALGLSELAGRKTRIDSLFIDEGFGTLDSETLDMAIATLENLQAQSKLIGIISHVEALKERITTQIQVQKMHNGVSKLVVVG